MRILAAALVSLLLLPACGAQKADPVPEVAGGGNEGAEVGLDRMVLPQEGIPGLPLGLRLSSNSGWEGNRAEADGSFDPDDSAESLGEAGRLTGYDLGYYDPTRAALRSGTGVDEVLTWVELFSSSSAASAYLRDRVGYARGLAGTSPRPGVSFGAVLPFDPGMAADEAFGLRESVDFGDDRVFRTTVRFRRGRIVAGGMVVRADNERGIEDAKNIAGLLDSRIQSSLSGGKRSEPVPIPKDGVPLDDGEQATAERPPGAPDLAPIALGSDDLPPGIPCEPGRYTHTTPPRITFRRSFCPQGATVGQTSLTGLTSSVSVFESAEVAKVSLTLTVMSAKSPGGIKAFIAEYAASTGLLPTNTRRRQVKLEGGGIGMLTAFDTNAGPRVNFYALVQSGRALTTLDADGPAAEFDYRRDMLPLLRVVERRLGTLG